MSEKIFCLLLFLGGSIYLFFSFKISAPFAYDPLGPRAFPLFLAIGLVLISGYRFFLLDNVRFQFSAGTIRSVCVVVFYLVALHSLGFMLTTTVAVYAIARFVGASWMEGTLTGLIVAIVFYGVFYFLLGVDLPLGSIYRVIG